MTQRTRPAVVPRLWWATQLSNASTARRTGPSTFQSARVVEHLGRIRSATVLCGRLGAVVPDEDVEQPDHEPHLNTAELRQTDRALDEGISNMSAQLSVTVVVSRENDRFVAQRLEVDGRVAVVPMHGGRDIRAGHTDLVVCYRLSPSGSVCRRLRTVAKRKGTGQRRYEHAELCLHLIQTVARRGANRGAYSRPSTRIAIASKITQ